MPGAGHEILAASPNTGVNAGPERLPMVAPVKRHFDGIGETREVMTDDAAP